jgi:hypothetical protein
MRIRKLWTALAVVLVTSVGVHSAGAQAGKATTKSAAKSDTTKKSTAAVAPAGKAAEAPKKSADAPKKGASKSATKGASGTAPKSSAAKSAPGNSAPKTTAAKPADASGKCKDGSYTKAATKQGACSSHGGVAEWYKS